MNKLFPLNTETKRILFWTIVSIAVMSTYMIAGMIFGSSMIMLLFALIVVFLSTVMHPQVGIYTILICTMWFERYFTLAPITIGSVVYKIYPLDFCILFLALSLVARLVEGKIKFKTQALDWFILVFGGVCTLSLLSSYWRGLDMAVAVGTYKNYFLYAVLYVILTIVMQTKEEWVRLLNWLIAAGFGLFFFLFYGLIAGHGLWSEYTPLSTSGERLIAGTHIFYLMLFLFWLAAAYLYREVKEKNKWQSVAVIVGMSLAGLALVVSLVRHLWLAVPTVLIFWIIFLPTMRRRLKFLILIGIVGALTAVLTFIFIYSGRVIHGSNAGQTFANTSEVLSQRTDIENVTSGNDSSFSWRLAVWKVGFSAWLTHPFFGLGLGHRITGLINNWPFDIALREIHNDYLAMLYQMGVVGLIAVLEFLVFLWYIFFHDRSFLLDNESLDGRLFFSFWSMAILFMIGFLVSVYWDVNFFVIWWWLAIAGLRFVCMRQPVTTKIFYEDTSDK
ncbi:MAG: O-antigen ligase family protein [Patescibacteria group bacterium]